TVLTNISLISSKLNIFIFLESWNNLSPQKSNLLPLIIENFAAIVSFQHHYTTPLSYLRCLNQILVYWNIHNLDHFPFQLDFILYRGYLYFFCAE
ncbi:hypothetical protein Avbf_13614, partial [Armadillidium vulgare]